jgi:hypothetical protein
MKIHEFHQRLSSPMRFFHVAQEAKEFAQATSIPELYEEWNDVVLSLQLALYYKNLWPGFFPILPGLGLATALKFERRCLVWEIIFRQHQLVFHRKYLHRGSNYQRDWKVREALTEAMRDQNSFPDIDWAWIASL